MRWPRFDAPRIALYAIAVGGTLVEVAALKATSMVSTLPLSAQATAVLPVAAFHDVRWLLVYASSWPVFVGELVLAIAVRGLILAAMVRAAWPTTRPPPWRTLLVRSAAGTFVALVAMSPWAVLSFVTAVTSLSIPLIGGLIGALVVGVFVISHVGVAPRWWARWPPWRAMAWTAVDFLVVTVAAVGIGYASGWLVLAPAAGAGVLNAWCLEEVVAACAAERAAPSRLRMVLGPSSLAIAVVGVTLVFASAVAAEGSPRTPSKDVTQPPPRHGQRVVLLVDGFESTYNGGAPPGFQGFYTTEFSYRGLGPSGQPLPYGSAATTASLPVLASRLANQIYSLEAVSGRPLDIVAVSEGTYIVRQYLEHYPTSALHTVVLSSPLPRPDRVYYPPAGRSTYGLVAGWETRLLLSIPETEAPRQDITANMAFIRSLVDQGPLFRQRSLCPVPGVRIVALLPMTAAVGTPPGPVSGVPAGVVPAIHATLLSQGEVRQDIGDVLGGQPLDKYFGWGLAFQLTRYAASAWETPALSLNEVPAWRAAGGTKWGDAEYGTYGCPAPDHPETEPPSSTASPAGPTASRH